MQIEPHRSLLDRVDPGLMVAGVRAWLYLGIVACTVAALLVLSAIAGLVVPLVIAMLFYPVVDWLVERRIPRQLASIGVIRIDPAGFIETFVAARGERLAAAVTAGTLTREEADARLATARSLATARIYQPVTALGPGGQGRGQGTGFVDADGDGACDHMPAGGQGRTGGGRGPRR